MQALLTILSIIIGLVFVLLLFSLLTSTVMEIIAAMLSLRGKHLLFTLQNMLGNKTDDFMRHPFFRQLSYAAHHKKSNASNYKLPSWISKKTFSAVLLDILEGDLNTTDILQKIQKLPDGDLKNLLLFLYKNSDGTAAGFKLRVENWFDEVMDRASEWYKRSIKWWLFGVGFVLAAIFNADTIKIYQSLSANSTLRQDFVAMAERTVEKSDSVRSMNLSKTLEQSGTEFRELSKIYTEVVQSPLGLGWTEREGGGSLPHWLIKLLGLVLTGVAVTFGAPFWFEILKKLIAVKNLKLPDGESSTPTGAAVIIPTGNQHAAVAAISGKKEEENIFESTRRGGVRQRTTTPPTENTESATATSNAAKSRNRNRRRNKPKPADDTKIEG